MQDKLRLASLKDPVTGLYNYAYMSERLDQEISLHSRHGEKFSVIMIDVDHFKRVNDEFGHPAGDEVLVTLAHMMQDMLRQEDTACRYGGEEFMVILPQTDEAAAALVAEKLRQSVEAVRWQIQGLRITLSFGVSEYVSGVAKDLVKHADNLLYQAKQSGRNKILHGRCETP